LSYGAGSSFEARREGGQMLAAAQTKNPSATEVLGLIAGEMDKWNWLKFRRCPNVTSV